jgi:hypothetical protein
MAKKKKKKGNKIVSARKTKAVRSSRNTTRSGSKAKSFNAAASGGGR